MAKGKNVFTTSEINILKHLVNKKVFSSKNEQKRIRNEVRAIGFYFSDFSNKKGYTVGDLEELICSEEIEVVDDSYVFSESIIETENMRGAIDSEVTHLQEWEYPTNCVSR